MRKSRGSILGEGLGALVLVTLVLARLLTGLPPAVRALETRYGLRVNWTGWNRTSRPVWKAGSCSKETRSGCSRGTTGPKSGCTDGRMPPGCPGS